MSSYKYIIIPLITIVICQIIKFTIESILSKKLKWNRLFNGAGGMPSAHTSFSASLTTLIGFCQGFDSPIFAVALVFTFIVSYDSMGLRLESEKQAIAINHIMDSLFTKQPKKAYQHLKEELGHKPIEVLMGLLLGILVSVIYLIKFP